MFLFLSVGSWNEDLTMDENADSCLGTNPSVSFGQISTSLNLKQYARGFKYHLRHIPETIRLIFLDHLIHTRHTNPIKRHEHFIGLEST